MQSMSVLLSNYVLSESDSPYVPLSVVRDTRWRLITVQEHQSELTIDSIDQIQEAFNVDLLPGGGRVARERGMVEVE